MGSNGGGNRIGAVIVGLNQHGFFSVSNTISNKYSLIMRSWNSQIGEECKRRNELRDYERVFCK